MWGSFFFSVGPPYSHLFCSCPSSLCFGGCLPSDILKYSHTVISSMSVFPSEFIFCVPSSWAFAKPSLDHATLLLWNPLRLPVTRRPESKFRGRPFNFLHLDLTSITDFVLVCFSLHPVIQLRWTWSFLPKSSFHAYYYDELCLNMRNVFSETGADDLSFIVLL